MKKSIDYLRSLRGGLDQTRVDDLKVILFTDAIVTPVSISLTQTSAEPGTVRSIYGKNTTKGTSMTSGNLVGVRGEANIKAGCTMSGSYLYGVQGKLITNASIITNGTYAGVFGQLDMTGATVNGGKIAGLYSDIFGVSSGTFANVDGVYVEHVGGGVINSMYKAIAKSTYVFDLSSNTHNQMSLTGTCTTPGAGHGWLKVLVEGAVRYIPLAEAVS